MRTTFNQLREVKDSLPKGSSAIIAEELGITADDVRAFFNGTAVAGYHIEQGPDGGIVILEDTKILDVALRIAWAHKHAL
ncbi:MAG: DNA-binding protein [Paludibacteraceae bacterium]|nr:DNA-binding protein [Paludibacteraceae bacterium]